MSPLSGGGELVRAMDEARVIPCDVGTRNYCRAGAVGLYAVPGVKGRDFHLCQAHASFYRAYLWVRITCPCHKEAQQ